MTADPSAFFPQCDDITAAFAVQTRTMMIGLISAVVLVALCNALAVLAG